MKKLGLALFIFIAAAFVILNLSSCASKKKLMKNCELLGSSYFECEEFSQ